jgi:Ca-activated chloride channel family protein
MVRRKAKAARSKTTLTVLVILVVAFLIVCATGLIVIGVLSRSPQSRELTLNVAYSPEKMELFEEVARQFNAANPRLRSGKRVKLVVSSLAPDEMVEKARENAYQAISPDSSIWLAEIDRRWAKEQGTDSALVGETTRYMVSPVVIAMWSDTAKALGYPGRELGWQDLLKAAAERAEFKWSHPSANTASGMLATLAMFYAGAGVTRGLTEQAATAQSTLDYVSRIEKTVKHYGEGELAVMEQIELKGKDFLDAFIVQEQLVVRYNARHAGELVAIYPVEGTLWEDHPLALLEHPARTDEERLAYSLLKQFLVSHDAQMLILRYGYRPTDLTIRLDQPESPISTANGADPAKPYTTLQIPSPSVISVVRNAWQYTKRHTNIYLVSDVSGSMEGEKLEDAKAALRVFLDQIQGDVERVGLIAFSTTVRENVPLTQLGAGRKELENAVDALSSTGQTSLLDAVELALVKLQDLGDAERINAIVVMTDGKENRSRIGLRELSDHLQRASQSGMPVVVFCIAYGSDADMNTLEAISSASGGFTKRGDLETIKALYKTLSTYF